MDALSEVLGSIRFSGGHIEAHANNQQAAQKFLRGDRSLLIVRKGTLRLTCREAGVNSIELREGDVAVLAFGFAFSVSYPEAASGGDAEDRYERSAAGACEWLRGTFTIDARLSGRLLSSLPKAMILHQVKRDALGWLETAAKFALTEIETREPGATLMISRIMELLFIRILRLWAVDPRAGASWLVGATDPGIGRVLGLIHASPEKKWSVTQLAKIVGSSRSVFASQFARLVGQPPHKYLIGLRLDQAAELLLRTDMSVADVALASGYDSEAAFSRAFKLKFSASPSHWRRQ